MNVTRITTADALADLAAPWNRLSQGMPFRSWDWLATWWRHYGSAGRLFTLAVWDEGGVLIAIAPWYLAWSHARGRLIRFLGSGEVCTDHQTILCLPGFETTAARAIADELTSRDSQTGKGRSEAETRWDLLELCGVDADEFIIGRLVGELAGRGCGVHRRAGMSCWRLELPETWEQYLQVLSKSTRKKVRRIEDRMLGTGRAVLHTVERPEELPRAVDQLIELHQRRWQSLGEPGCFASEAFANFHREVTSHLLRAGQLRLHLLALDGKVVAAEYDIQGAGTVYAYQSGVDPASLEEEPGRIMAVATFLRGIAEGNRGFDFLRGDEPYKATWRAQPCPTVELRISSPRTLPRMRQGAWVIGQTVKQWAQRGWLGPENQPHSTI